MQVVFDRALLILMALALWQGLHWLSPLALASPFATAEKLISLVESQTFWSHARETAKATVFAFAIALAAGLTTGLLAGMSRTSAQMTEPVLSSIYGLPKVTLYPVILLVFGLGLPAKIAFGALHAFFPIALFTLNGVRKLPPVYLRTAQVMRLTRFQKLTTLMLPAALPEIVSGIRVGASLTILGVLIGEMFASQRGLGFLIMNAIGLHETETMLAVTLFLACVAIAINLALLRLDNRLGQRFVN